MKNILVPTDFSPSANAAASVALKMASKAGASIHFLHLFDQLQPTEHHVPSEAVGKHAHQDAEAGQAKENLNQLVEQADKLSVRAFPIFVLNDGNQSIEDYTKAYSIDFVVMGSHGHRNFRERLLGSNTRRLIRDLELPVLVMKEGWVSDLRSVLFASTFGSDLAHASKQAITFAGLLNAKLNFLQVRLVNDKADASQVQERLRQLKALCPASTSFNHVETNDVDWAVADFCERIGADIIALSRHERYGATQLVTHSIAEHLVKKGKHPVLVL